MSNYDVMFKGLIFKQGNTYNSLCLDVDVSAGGNSPEEARINLIKAVELHTTKGTLYDFVPLQALSVELAFLHNYEAVVDEFYFKQNIGVLGNALIDDSNSFNVAGDEADEEKFRIISITGKSD